MLLKYSAVPLQEITTDTLVIFTPEIDKVSGKTLKSLDSASSGAVSSLIASEEFTGKNEESAVIHQPQDFKAKKVILLGLGSRKDINADSFRKASGTASRLRSLTSTSKAVFYFDGFNDKHFFQAAIEGYLLGGFKVLDYKTLKPQLSLNLCTLPQPGQ